MAVFFGTENKTIGTTSAASPAPAPANTIPAPRPIETAAAPLASERIEVLRNLTEINTADNRETPTQPKTFRQKVLEKVIIAIDEGPKIYEGCKSC